MASKLIAKKGPAAGVSYSLEQQEIFIGRDLSNDIVINDPEISRRHSRLYKQGNDYVIEDLGSTNGTSVNQQRLASPCHLKNNDAVSMSQNISFVFETDEPMVSEQATVAVSSLNLDEGATLVADETNNPLAGEFISPTPAIPDEFAQSPVFTDTQDQQSFNAPQSATPSGGKRSQKPAKKRNFPVWILIAIIAIILLCVIAGALALWYIDSNFLWCDVMPFLPGCQLN